MTGFLSPWKLIGPYLVPSPLAVGSGPPHLRVCLYLCDALLSPWVEIAHQTSKQETQVLFLVSMLLAFRGLESLPEPSLAWMQGQIWQGT